MGSKEFEQLCEAEITINSWIEERELGHDGRRAEQPCIGEKRGPLAERKDESPKATSVLTLTEVADVRRVIVN